MFFCRCSAALRVAFVDIVGFPLISSQGVVAESEQPAVRFLSRIRSTSPKFKIALRPLFRYVVRVRSKAPAGSREGPSPLSSNRINGTYNSVLPVCEPQAEAWRSYVP